MGKRADIIASFSSKCFETFFAHELKCGDRFFLYHCNGYTYQLRGLGWKICIKRISCIEFVIEIVQVTNCRMCTMLWHLFFWLANGRALFCPSIRSIFSKLFLKYVCNFGCDGFSERVNIDCTLHKTMDKKLSKQ